MIQDFATNRKMIHRYKTKRTRAPPSLVACRILVIFVEMLKEHKMNQFDYREELREQFGDGPVMG
jgi:hypothetical protein